MMTKIFVKRITAMIVAFSLLAGSAVYAAEPVRETFEASGAYVAWDEGSRTVSIDIMGGLIELEVGSDVAIVNGAEVSLGTAVFLQDDRAFVSDEDLMILSLALMGVGPAEGKHGVAVATMQSMAAQLLELTSSPDLSFSIVDVNSGFSSAMTVSDVTDADTIFHLGSIGKTFTAVAVMQMVEKGLIDLDTPIVEYLPTFSVLPGADGVGDYRNITPRMLLSHTSGIYTNDIGSGFITYGGHYQDYMNNFLERFATSRMISEEGTVFQYANTGFVILGILVAHLAGHENYFEGFNQHMLENIFEPMGLSRTSFVMTPELFPYVAQPYTAAGIPREFQYWNPLPTGTMFSTANEMVSLMAMFLNGGYYNGQQILSPESVDLMFTDQTGIGNYGLGIAFMGDPTGIGYSVVGHNGGMIYNSSAMFLDREFGLGVFSATNSTSSAGINEAIAGAVLGTAVAGAGGVFQPVTHVDPAAVPVEMPLEEMEALVGFYLAGGALGIFVEIADGKLFMRVPEQGLHFELVPMSDGHFSTELGIVFWLIAGDDGEVLFVQGPNRDMVGGTRIDTDLFVPDDHFMENWYGFTFVPFSDNDRYVFMLESVSFGIDENGMAYMDAVNLTQMPGTVQRIPQAMDTDVELQYENGKYFFELSGVRFVRQ